MGLYKIIPVLLIFASIHQIEAETIDALEELKNLRINDGPFTGGYLVSPSYNVLNWYFANLGLMPMVRHLSAADLDHYIRKYLDLYLSNVRSDFRIDDVKDPKNSTGYSVKASDSDDSYAATMLSLAVKYMRASQNISWWGANKKKMSHISYNILAKSLQSKTGLTSSYAPTRNENYTVGMLMDNTEVYRGLRDFAQALRDFSSDEAEYPYANYCDQLAKSIANGIKKLFYTGVQGFYWNDWKQLDNNMYPGAMCQVCPQVFNVSEVASRFDPAWNHFSELVPDWETGRYIKSYTQGVLAYAAAQRGENAKAQSYLAVMEDKFASRRGSVIISDLGWYWRTRNLLQNQPDI